MLTIVDQCTRECPILEPGISLTRNRVVACLNEIGKHRLLPKSITVDDGFEFAGRALDTWEYQNGFKLDFIRLGKPLENAFIETFNVRLRDGFLNTKVLLYIADVRKKLEGWINDYNYIRTRSVLECL